MEIDLVFVVLLQQTQLPHQDMPVANNHVVLFWDIFLYMTIFLIVGVLLNETKGGDLQTSFRDGSASST